MPRIAPLPEAEAQDKVATTYGRIKEMLGGAAIPEAFLYYGRVEAFVQDFYMNFKKFVFAENGKLNVKLRTIVGLAVSGHYGCELWIDYFSERLKAQGGTDAQVTEVLAIASTNAMYNSFFKFRDLSGSDIFAGMPVGLRAHTFMGTSFDEKTVELINIAISNLNACKPCTSGHVTKARDLGASDDELLETVQCASTMAAGCAFLKAIGV
jgi:alkyl hydroperoxide reductase subunit D